ncbi:dihydrodipicolinate synthase family protein, partial [Candidatus Poribacteria bacterium]
GELASKAVLMGGDGIVPGAGNVVPHLYRELYEAAKKGDVRTAERLQRLADEVAGIYVKGRTLSQALAALKAMMSELGLCEPTVLPPLITLEEGERRRIADQMRRLAPYLPRLNPRS